MANGDSKITGHLVINGVRYEVEDAAFVAAEDGGELYEVWIRRGDEHGQSE